MAKDMGLVLAETGAVPISKEVEESEAGFHQTEDGDDLTVIASDDLMGDADDDEDAASNQSDSDLKVDMIKQRSKMEKTVIMLTAAGKGESDKLFENVGEEVDINATDELKRTALHVAASHGHLGLVEQLLNAKVDPYTVDAFGNTALNDAVRHRHDTVAELIRKRYPKIVYKLPGSELGVAMCTAASIGDVEQINRLVLSGVDVNEADYDGRTALHLAACEGHVLAVEYLLKAKCDIACKDRFGGTPLDDLVRHHFDLPNAAHVQALLRAHGASLMQSKIDYTVQPFE